MKNPSTVRPGLIGRKANITPSTNTAVPTVSVIMAFLRPELDLGGWEARATGAPWSRGARSVLAHNPHLTLPSRRKAPHDAHRGNGLLSICQRRL